MERYETYKTSGISWIGEIPSHWDEATIGHIFDIVAGGDAKPELYSYEKDSIHIHPVYTNTKGENSTYAFTSDPPFGPNAITVTGRGDIGRAFYRDHLFDAIVRLLVLTPRSSNLDGRYYAFFINSIQGMTSDSAAIGQLSTQQIYPFKATIPPLDEQKKIVEFLSTKTSQIDAQQRERERELRLLDELKQAEIANVVTRGLNPDVPMRETNIPWLDVVPQHWDEKRAKYLFIKQNRPVRDEDEVITCFRDGQVTLRRNRRTEGFTESFKEIGYQGIRKGDLVVHQMDAFAGSSGVSDSDGKSTPVYIVCTPAFDNIYIPYFALVFRRMGLNGYIQSLYRGIRERSSNFSYDVFCNQILPIPPIEEQKAIVEYIQQKNSAIDEMIANLRAEIDFLTEYKQRLIADVVTGQLKVD